NQYAGPPARRCSMKAFIQIPFICFAIAAPALSASPQIHLPFSQNPQAPNSPPQAAVAKTPDKLPDKPTLAFKALAGQSARYKTQGTLTMESGGNKVNMEVTEIEKVTFTAIAPNGDITMERDTESSEQSVNGRKMPSPPDENHKYTIVIKPSGALVSHKADKG